MQISLLFATITLACGVGFSNAQETDCSTEVDTYSNCTLTVSENYPDPTFADLCNLTKSSLDCANAFPEECYANISQFNETKVATENVFEDICSTTESIDCSAELSTYIQCVTPLVENPPTDPNDLGASCSFARAILDCIDALSANCTGPGTQQEIDAQEAIIEEFCATPEPTATPPTPEPTATPPTPEPTATPPTPEPTATCLGGDMTVQTPRGLKLTKDLSVGDMVSVGSGRFEPVVWNSQHRNGNENVKAAFVEFSLENGETVSLTPNHFAKTTEGLILAGKVQANQSMITKNHESVRIQSVQRTMKQGVYNPQTPSQQIEVNGVVASTRSEHSPEFMGLIFQVLAFFHSIVPTAVFSTTINGVSTYVYEPIMFGGDTWALPVVTLFFAGAGMKALKA